MTCIDAHCHLWGPDSTAYPYAPHDGLERPKSACDTIAMRAAHATVGVDGALVIQPRIYGYDSSYLYDQVHAAGGYLRAMPLINVVRPSSIAELRAHATDPATAGARVIALGNEPASWLTSQMAHLVWSEMEALHLPVGFLIDPQQLPLAAQVARAHPALTVVIDHLARIRPQMVPSSRPELTRISCLPNVMIKVSAIDSLSEEGFPYSDMHPLVSLVSESFGAQRMMWGSDWPHVGAPEDYRLAHDAMREALSGMCPTDLELVFGGTANEVFRFRTTGELSRAAS